MEMVEVVGEIVEKIEGGIPSAQNKLSYDNSSITESVDVVAASATEPASTQYSQVEYPLMELSPAERELLELDIEKYKCETENNPYNHTVWKKLGDAYKAAGMYKDAIPTFQTAISLNPQEPSYHYRLGLIFAAERREAEALLEFHRVLELDSDYAEAHASLASHYRKMGLEELAQFHIEKALNAKLENESEYNRACLEAICGNYDRALELLEIALQSRQTYVNWIQNDPDLDVLRDDRRFHELISTYAASEQL
jgi:tetratricopeptide (TPR) repeat protein